MCKYCDFGNYLDDSVNHIINLNTNFGILGSMDTDLFLSVDWELQDDMRYKKSKHELVISNTSDLYSKSKGIKIKYCPFCGKKLESK